MRSKNATGQVWQADRYAENAHFVPVLGQSVLELLEVRPGEKILDLGCGDGVLTEKIATLGADVTGIDESADMVAAARRRGLNARVASSYELSFCKEFDAVFSNAALHWMKGNPDAVIAGANRALKRGGRFVAEMGGHGNVAAITVAMLATLEGRDVQDPASAIPWYFPSPEAYRAKLEASGFAVNYIELIPRLTPLPTGMAAWIETFGMSFIRRLPEVERTSAIAETVDRLRTVLCDERGLWTGDYVRLRFSATKK